MRRYGFSPSVQSILEEIRAGKEGPVLEGLPAGAQAAQGGGSPATPSAGRGTNANVKATMPVQTATQQAGTAQQQLATSVANQQMDKRAMMTGQPTAQSAETMAAQPRPAKTNPTDARKAQAVQNQMVKQADQDNDGQLDSQEKDQQQRQPYVPPEPIKQPGQTVAANEAVDLHAETLAQTLQSNPGNVDETKRILRAVVESLEDGIMEQEIARRFLVRRFGAQPEVQQFLDEVQREPDMSIVENISKDMPFTNPDEADGLNDRPEVQTKVDAKRKKSLQEPAGYQGHDPARRSQSAESDPSDYHTEINAMGVLTSEQQDSILDDVFGED